MTGAEYECEFEPTEDYVLSFVMILEKNLPFCNGTTHIFAL